MASGRETPLRDEKVAVIGSGLIGRSWAMLFACGGYQVALYDVDSNQLTRALADIQQQLQTLADGGHHRGTLSPEVQFARIKSYSSLEDCVAGSVYIQECVPENQDLKRRIFNDLDRMISETTVIGSSTSAMMPSTLFDHLKNRERFLVAHPVNPPFYTPLVEIAGAPWTSGDAVNFTEQLMASVEQDPVVLKKEIDGFILGRLQFAVQAESWALIRDGYVESGDVERAMTESLGMWYAFMGPFQAEHLNSDGFVDCTEKYSDMVFRVQQSMKAPERMRGDTMDRIFADLEREFSPLDELDHRRQWRDNHLAALAQLKSFLGTAGEQG